MTKSKSGLGCMTTLNFHPEVPFLTRPKTLGEKLIKGVKFYLGVGKKKYRADLFDKFFKTDY